MFVASALRLLAGSGRRAGELHGRGGAVGAGISCPAYAIDDQTASKVADGTVEGVSEGHGKLLTS